LTNDELHAQRRRGFVTGFLAGAAASLGVVAIVVAIAGGFTGSDVTTQAIDAIQRNYFKPVKRTALENSSVNGAIQALRKRYHDKFSHYFDPAQLKQFESSTSGQFSGVGLTVTGVKRGLRVASVLPNSPARRAGIKEGDLITEVDGHTIAGLPVEVSAAKIKGPPGTPVEVKVVTGFGKANGSGKARVVHLERAAVQLPVALGRIRRAAGHKVAYVRFVTFSEGAHDELRSTLERLYRRGATGLVLDLRGNGGGLLNEAVLTASVFLKKGQRVASTDSRTMGHKTYDAVGDPLDPRPAVVLINRDTASAAEILAAALGDHGLATIVGTRSYGKGTFQEVIHLAAGGALDLTVGRYFTADGSSLADKGIQPQVRAVDDPQTKPDEGLDRALGVLGAKLTR
jgi:carboxyl-terminal processing protease